MNISQPVWIFNYKGDFQPSIEFSTDMEESDLRYIQEMINTYMDTTYSPPSMELIHSPDKDYFLPALKVLVQDDVSFISPSYETRWNNLELVATCLRPSVMPPEYTEFHQAPSENCDCGIYGSVNLDEVGSYIHSLRGSTRTVLCIIEPSPGAKVVVCRKGWKASKAFISEIVDETMSVDEASNLLSMAWNRCVDVMDVYHENR